MIAKIIFRLNMLFLQKKFYRAGKISIKKFYSIKGYSNITIGSNFFANRFLRIEVFGKKGESKLEIGNNVCVGESVHIGVNNIIKIEDDVLMGSRIFISDHNHGNYSGNKQTSPDIPPNKRSITSGKKVTIEQNVWIGDGVAILPDVVIGAGSIIGANSVVTKDIPINSIAAGIPCKVIKQYDYNYKQWTKV